MSLGRTLYMSGVYERKNYGKENQDEILSMYRSFRSASIVQLKKKEESPLVV